MDERTRFIADFLRETFSISELCSQYGVSRKTGYKWIDRYLKQGPAGLEEYSRRPRLCPRQTPDHVVQAICEARRHHPSWGAKKLLTIEKKKHPEWPWPHRATIYDILNRNGLVATKRRRRPIGHPGKPKTQIDSPNQVWSADFKGHFRTGDGQYCYPLTVTDGYSRFLLGCQGLRSTSVRDAKPIFTRIFQEYGLPERIRTDNGVPFATVSLARLSTLSAWWVKLGVMPELIEPGKPQQNGRHERMHRTLKAETTRPPAANLPAQQRKFNSWRDEFNSERPHEALDQHPPAAFYKHSPRPMPSKLLPLEYPDRFEKRLVSENGGIRWESEWVNVSVCCAGEYVGLEEIDDGIWDVYFGPLRLGRFHERHMRIEDANGRLLRHR